MGEPKYAVIICDPPNKYIVGQQWGHRTVVEVVAYEGATRPKLGALSVASMVLHPLELEEIERRARLRDKGFWSVEALDDTQMEIADKARQADAVDTSLDERKKELEAVAVDLAAKESELNAMGARLEAKGDELSKVVAKLKKARADLAKADKERKS